MPKKIVSINLIKNQQGNLLERVINWSLTVGRALVIVTELVTLAAFLWRFGLDQQLIDLHTQIKQKQAIVSAFKKNEDEYRNLQNRLSIASSFAASGGKEIQTYQDILKLSIPGITFNKVSSSTDKITMGLNATSVSSLSSFVNTLKAYPMVEGVSIDKIETKASNGIIVISITVALKPVQNQYANEIK